MKAAILRDMRQQKGWTQERTAKALGVTQAYLSMLERGQRPLPSELAHRALTALHLSPTVLPLPVETDKQPHPSPKLEYSAELGGLPHAATKDDVMNRYLALILTTSCCLVFVATTVAEDSLGSIENHETIRVATALNHLTVLEFGEPVTLVAAGGTDFQIERQDNKVFVKPLKSSVSTNLFVWTASHRFSYELEGF